MPWKSKKQQRWGHGEGGKKAGLDVEEWDEETDFESLPEEAEAGKGPCRTPGPGKKLSQKVKDARRSSREVHEGMPKGGFHSKKGYNRKEKHPKDPAEGAELTEIDETYRGINFPLASVLSWGPAEGRPCGEGEDPQRGHCTPEKDLSQFGKGAAQFFRGGEQQEKATREREKLLKRVERRKRMASLAASLDWSTHKSETFDDTGKDGGHPAWGLKSIIDRGVKPHEKPAGDKRIGDGQTTNRSNGEGKKFKAYSMAGAFAWS